MYLFKPPPPKPKNHFLSIFLSSVPALGAFLNQVLMWIAAFSSKLTDSSPT